MPPGQCASDVSCGFQFKVISENQKNLHFKLGAYITFALHYPRLYLCVCLSTYTHTYPCHHYSHVLHDYLLEKSETGPRRSKGWPQSSRITHSSRYSLSLHLLRSSLRVSPDRAGSIRWAWLCPVLPSPLLPSTLCPAEGREDTTKSLHVCESFVTCGSVRTGGWGQSSAMSPLQNTAFS